MNALPNADSTLDTEANPELLLPLDRMATGRPARVRKLRAAADLSCRLREIGFCEGNIVRLVCRHPNLICQVCETRLALNSALAGMILVEAA
jgi:Fe2+ transport system protein FeoA